MNRADTEYRKDIIRMAREADFGDGIVEFIGVQKFERFAALVASAERDACALLCYEQRKNWDALACADAIRAGTKPRGQA